MSWAEWAEIVCSGATPPPAPPVFTSVPDGGCLDVETTVCAECEGGTVTGWRWRVNGGPWTTVSN